MSSADVRAAVTQFLQAADIPGLSRVYPAAPYWADGSEWDLQIRDTDGTLAASAAIGALHLTEESESRVALPAKLSIKRVEYTIGLMIFYQYLLPTNQQLHADESGWTDPLDVIIDGVKARLRSDPNCGLPAVVWQSAQAPNDLLVRRDLPRLLPGKVLSWNVIEFRVTEMIQPD